MMVNYVRTLKKFIAAYMLQYGNNKKKRFCDVVSPYYYLISHYYKQLIDKHYDLIHAIE